MTTSKSHCIATWDGKKALPFMKVATAPGLQSCWSGHTSCKHSNHFGKQPLFGLAGFQITLTKVASNLSN